MAFRIAAVSFLNTIPLVDWFAQPQAPDVVLSRDLPSRLTAKLTAGEADVALLPVVEILRGASGGMISSSGIACRGPVGSVKLYACDDLDSLVTVAADRGSRSSVALLRILLAEKYGISPEFREIEPQAGSWPVPGEGLLVIGDRCFQYERLLRETDPPGIKSWDLGQLWLELTGLPFVFATWAVAPDFAERAGSEKVGKLGSMLDQARDHGLSNLDALAAREAAAGRLGHAGRATAAAIDYYFRESLRFEIGEAERTGLRRFYELCRKHAIIPAGPLPPVL